MAFSPESPSGPPTGDLEVVLQRLDTDPEFKASVVRDPKAALAEIDLPAEDLRRLTEHLADEHEVLDPVEQRTSKAGLFALLSGARARSVRSRVSGRRQLIAADVSGFQFDPGADPDPDLDPGADLELDAGSDATAERDPGPAGRPGSVARAGGDDADPATDDAEVGPA